jgi:endonuclease YncB( thermonuclease family)
MWCSHRCSLLSFGATVMFSLFLHMSACAGELRGYAQVVDGDTVRLNGSRIRLEGIDAPETDQVCLNGRGRTWGCGIESRDRLKQYAEGKEWVCQAHGADKYRRVLATCSVGGTDDQHWMVLNGWALSFVRYSHQYDAEQDAARAASAGLWSGAFIAPWDWRQRKPKTEILGAVSVPTDAQSLLLAAAPDAPSPFERPSSEFIARFIGGHNVLPWKNGMIAIRADRCTLGVVGDCPHVLGRVAVIEYQGPVVRVALTTDEGVEVAALVPDQLFYRRSVGVGDMATLSWPEEAAHELAP